MSLQSDGASYVTVEKFTYEMFNQLVMNLNQNRGPDTDSVREAMLVATHSLHTFSLTLMNCL